MNIFIYQGPAPKVNSKGYSGLSYVSYLSIVISNGIKSLLISELVYLDLVSFLGVTGAV